MGGPSTRLPILVLLAREPSASVVVGHHNLATHSLTAKALEIVMDIHLLKLKLHRMIILTPAYANDAPNSR